MTVFLLVTLTIFGALAVFGAASHLLERDSRRGDSPET